LELLMRRIAAVVFALAALSSCDPTGNVVPTNTSQVRFAAFVYDVGGGVNVTTDGVALTTGLLYGSQSAYDNIAVDSTIFTVNRVSDNFLLGSDTLLPVLNARYTMYMLGTIGGFKSLIAPDDTVLADSGKVKLRFVHGVRTDSLFGFDLYITTPGADISGITPNIASLTYGAASTYVVLDTAARQLRVTHAGVKTIELDTTFAGPVADSQVVTVVAADQPGGGRRLQRVIDRAP
jgi:hypothetical protein